MTEAKTDLSKLDGTERTQEYVDRLNGILAQMSKAPAEQRNPIVEALLGLFRDWNQDKIKAYREGKPIAVTWYGNAPEILNGMGILNYNPVVDLMMHLGFTNYADAYKCDSFPLDGNVCSLIRYAIYAVQNRLLVKPSVIIAMGEPCDGELMVHQAMKESDFFGSAPIYQIDPSYGHDRKDFEYVARQLKEMAHWLEKVTGAKYDFKRVATVVDETNEQYRIWKEINECMKASPAPLPGFTVPEVMWPLTQHLPAGDPRCTAVARMLLGAAQENVKKHVGPVMKNEIRIVWPDLDPLWNGPLTEWLAKKWNATVVMTDQQYSKPYEVIDTSSEDAMFYGLARRAVFEVPMIRQGRGFVDVLIEDLTDMINEYHPDVVIAPGHMGHKDKAGNTQFLKKVCRDMGVPLLNLTTSLFDERYTPLEKVENDISNFLSVNGFKPNPD
ncbi:2-hydroxyacyl-CoA dehydratase family protein [Mesosutterella sp. AGMB02718]|uniref:2-hydroxyacyl-CoA dehydratase family protein n=1 Tax=Mesosutterella faecium TaxID=2925194 RepID=A0ABT7IP64_9BURK|nr:2-hydroxyacyl-CoA dehydratase family protein [Mesosutterella sp. AGMB02718]MDL2060172.1 2-hydroxyacyl-CoA dehydratase family protein [Mesosutterella sp. AGMB02718]